MRTMLLLLVLAAACTESADPARLDHAQILAVRAEPSHVLAGERTRIDVLAGGGDGQIFEAEPEAVTAGELAVEHTAEGWFVRAGEQRSVTATVSITIDGEALRGEKILVFGDTAANPTVITMQVDGSPQAALTATVGARPSISAIGTGVEPLAYAWYSSLGDLEHYRQQTTVLAADRAAEGTIVVVVRDAQGGVAWQPMPGRVE